MDKQEAEKLIGRRIQVPSCGISTISDVVLSLTDDHVYLILTYPDEFAQRIKCVKTRWPVPSSWEWWN